MNFTEVNATNLITHDADTLIGLEQYRNKLKNHPSLALPLEQTLEFLDQLIEFPLRCCRFLLHRNEIFIQGEMNDFI